MTAGHGSSNDPLPEPCFVCVSAVAIEVVAVSRQQPVGSRGFDAIVEINHKNAKFLYGSARDDPLIPIGQSLTTSATNILHVATDGRGLVSAARSQLGPTTTRSYHNSVLPQFGPTTIRSYHNSVLPQFGPTTIRSYHNSALSQLGPITTRLEWKHYATYLANPAGLSR